MKMVFVGPPGAGKGTQADKIVAKYQVLHLSTGDMLRAARDAKTPTGLKAEEYMSAGQLVPDEVIIGIIRERLSQSDAQGGFLLDGFPRTLVQAEALDGMLKEMGTALDVVLELRVPEDELYKRLASRGRADDKPEVIRERLVAYGRQTEPLVGYYTQSGILKTVDGIGSVDEIFGRIENFLDPLK
ncbi:MAG: adenylate kinase [Thermoguttaceae bacterium]|nr:adenylate kinase [Thermoguttaceae bacterium]